MKKNILFLVVDCLRADHVDINGFDRMGLTPFIKTFSKKGVSFEKAITQSSWTKTSVASIFTGTYPFVHNVHNVLDKLPDDLPTIAELFQKNGYHTGYFTSNPYLAPGTGYERGFKVHRFINKDYGELLNDEIKAEIDNYKKNIESKDKPFFFYIQYMDAHQPYRVHSDENRIEKERVMAKWNTGLKSAGQVKIEEKELKILKELYQKEIAYSDKLINEIIDYINKKELLDNTLIIITGDHGIELMEHGGLYHSPKLYKEVIEVPCIFVGPNIKNNRIIKGRIRSIDITTTILNYAEIDIPKSMKGKSLLNFINNSINEVYMDAYSERDRTHENLKIRALIKDNWKIIKYEKDKNILLKGIESLFTHIKKGEFKILFGAVKAGFNFILRKVKSLRYSKKSDTLTSELFNLENDKFDALPVKNNKKTQELLNQISSFIKIDRAIKNSAEIDVNEEIKERLKSLGYMD